MTPERLELWIHKVVPGGRSLVLTHEQALGQGMAVASWTREDVDEARERATVPTISQQVLEAAQDHADSVGEACRFVVQWVAENGRALRSMIHRVQPAQPAGHEGAQYADAVTPNAIIGQLLGHVSGQQKVINGSIGVVLNAYERAMNMQQNLLKAQGEMLQQAMLEPRRKGGVQDNEQLIAMKVRAFEKLFELGPEVVQMAVAHFLGRGGGEPDNDASEPAAEDSPPAAAAPNGRSVS